MTPEEQQKHGMEIISYIEKNQIGLADSLVILTGLLAGLIDTIRQKFTIDHSN